MANHAIGEAIRRVRRNQCLGQTVLARRSGVSLSTISKIEQGQDSPKLATVIRIAQGLRMCPVELVREGIEGPCRVI